MNNYCIKVRRKGFNYYTDYMERYFDKVATQYDYHLVKNPGQAELSCITFIDGPYTGHSGSKWMIFISRVFNEAAPEQLKKLSQLIAECFKSESIIEEIDVPEILESTKNRSLKYGIPYLWYFSSKHSAFDEPPFLTEGETDLQIYSYTTFCTDGQGFLLSIQNHGGISKGLNIKISLDISAEDQVELYEFVLIEPKNKHEISRIPLEADQSIINNKKIYTIDLLDFIIPEGINEFSAKLSGRKKSDESSIRSFSLGFIPKGKDKMLKSMQIEIIPIEYPHKRVLWENND